MFGKYWYSEPMETSAQFGDAVGCPGRIAVFAENVSRRIQDALSGVRRAILRRQLAGPKAVWRSDGVHLRKSE